MLQQILRDMYIDPELLAELDEEQKQILFCKMRQEQKRRWEERESLLEREEIKKAKTPKANRKGNNVKFLEDGDLKPWTWVMGEHQDDLSIEELIEAENIRRAKLLVEQELNIISKNPSVTSFPLANGPQRDGSIDNDLTNETPLSSENKASIADMDSVSANTTMESYPETNSPEAETPKDVDTPQCPAEPPSPSPSSSSSSSDEAVQTTDNTPLLRSSKFVPPSGSYSRLFTAKDVPSKDSEKVTSAIPNVSNIDSSQNTGITPPSKTTSSITSTPFSSEPTIDQTAKNSDTQRPAFTVVKTTESSGSRLYSANVKPPISVKPVEKAPQIRSVPESPPGLSKKTEDFRNIQLTPTKSSHGTAFANQSSLSNNNSSPKTFPISVTKPAISTKPTDKFQQARADVNREGSTPNWNQKKLQNFSEMSLKERKSSDEGSGMDATTGSIVERAKLDMASFREKRMREIYSGIQSERQKSLERATKESKNIVQLWLAQEKKMKEADEERKLIARRVREDNARAMRRLRTESQILSLFTDDPTKPGYSIHSANQSMQRVQRPSSPADVICWYQEVELKKGAGLDPNTGKNAPYYYGMLSRKDAEKKLSKKAEGTFLVRLSTQIFGYAISLRGTDSFHNIKNIRHYLIEVTPTGYQFFGANQPTFLTLHTFIEHYKKKPLSLVTSDRLRMECGLLKDEDDDDDDGNDSSSSSSSDSVLGC